MKIRFRGANGKSYEIPVHEVVVLDDHGQAVACTYEAAPGRLVHSDASQSDWVKFATGLNLPIVPVKIIDPNT